jgi:NAD(P)-dependent dehydrogenase (short-subunit alcohol dehydrogenase family)
VQEFREQVAIVTGAGRGIGRAAAARLARAGAAVTLVDRDGAAADEAARELADAGLRVEPAAVDVTDGEAVRAVVERTAEASGRLDVLVNSAGIQRYGTVADTSEELWNEVLAVNLTGAFLTSKAAIPIMRQGGGGAIVHVSSTQAHAAQPGAAAYVASKGALNALTRAMAVDHAADGIRVNAVCPASVDTPMLRWAADHLSDGRRPDELLAEWGAAHPLGRVGAPEEVAEVIAFLAGPGAAFVTGADVRVDGGVLAALGVSTGARA